MQGFLGGDKGGSSNPLKQISGREGTDRSVFRDRQAPSGSGSQSSAQRPFSPAQNQQNGQVQQTPHPFNLSHLASALSSPAGVQARPPAHFDATWSQARAGPVAAPERFANAGWSENYSPQRPGPTENWANGFTAEGKGKGRAQSYALQPHPDQMYAQQMQGDYMRSDQYMSYGPQMGMGMGMGMGMRSGLSNGMPVGTNFETTYQASFLPRAADGVTPDPQALLALSKDEHAKMEAAFEKAFDEARSAGQEEAEKQEQEEGPPAEEMREAKGEFDKVWESLRPEAERLNKLAEWESEFSQFTNDGDDLFETLNDSLNRSDVGQTSLDDQLEFGTTGPDFTSFNRSDLPGYLGREDGVPDHEEYRFSQAGTSRHADLSPVQALIQARAILATGGSLSDASDLLESFLERATISDRAEAGVGDVEVWTLLGRTHAMNEKEDKAVAAFAQGRAAIEGSGGREQPMTGELLTNLAISYVNEQQDLGALTVLHQFLTISSPQFAGPKPARSSLESSSGPWTMHQQLTEQFLAVARHQFTSSGEVDPDVQVGLGTLYYMMGQYEEARGCWVNALGERPDDYLLWNRLGATLANGGNPEEAVDAYRRALELRPTFTRAIFNLGVACLNIGVHREAAEHFLAALSLHRDKGETRMNDDSPELWATLRRAFGALNLNDLAAQALPGADLNVFRAAGFDF